MGLCTLTLSTSATTFMMDTRNGRLRVDHLVLPDPRVQTVLGRNRHGTFGAGGRGATGILGDRRPGPGDDRRDYIHLDHAGGVGDLAQAFPNAQVVVHERGARHLADPSRLASAHRVRGGDGPLVRDLRPTDAHRLVAVGEVGSVDLGDGRHPSAFHNPGHASHHIGLVDSATGDRVHRGRRGVYVPETRDVRPGDSPPDFNLDLTLSFGCDAGWVRPGCCSAISTRHRHRRDAGRPVDELHAWVDTVRAAREVSPTRITP